LAEADGVPDVRAASVAAASVGEPVAPVAVAEGSPEPDAACPSTSAPAGDSWAKARPGRVEKVATAVPAANTPERKLRRVKLAGARVEVGAEVGAEIVMGVTTEPVSRTVGVRAVVRAVMGAGAMSRAVGVEPGMETPFSL
jgi:hypothetical protein